VGVGVRGVGVGDVGVGGVGVGGVGGVCVYLYTITLTISYV
jgi:hypothetical protein